MQAKVFPEENTLLSQLKLGDKEAFGRLYTHYSPLIFCHLKRLLKSENLAQELLQEVFIRIWKSRDKIDEKKSLGPYLFQIAANMGCDYFRKSLREQVFQKKYAHVEPVQSAPIEEEINRKENKAILSKAIALLPPKRRNIFILCKFEEKSYDEISSRLGISISTISDHIVKANHFIKRYLQAHTEG